MRIIIKICHMGNFLFREISAVTESQHGAECAIRQKGKKQPTVCAMIAQTVGFLRSYFTWFIHLSVSHMIGISYIYQMLWGSQVEIKGLTKNAKGSNSYGLTEMSHAGYNEIILLSGKQGNCGC